MSATVFKRIRANNVLVGAGAGFNEVSTSSGVLVLNSASSNDVRVTYDLPSNDRSLATKIYVDSVAAGLSAKDAVRVKSANLASIVNYSGSGAGKTITRNANGAISGDAATYFDNISLVLNDRVLVASETDGKNNGIYYVSNAGGAGAPWVLTRATDADNGGIISAEVKTGMYVFVTAGTVYNGSGWILITQGAITVDTTVLVFSQFSGAGTFTYANVGAGAGVWKDVTGSQVRFRSIIATRTAGDVGLITSTQNTDDVTINFDQSKITGTGTLVSGAINYTNASSITTSGAVTLNDQDLSGANKLTISRSGGTSTLYDGQYTIHGTTHEYYFTPGVGNYIWFRNSANYTYLKLNNNGVLEISPALQTTTAANFTIVGNSATAYKFTDGTNDQFTLDTTTGAQRLILNNNNLAFGGNGNINIANASSTALTIKSATKSFITIDTDTSDPTGDLVIFNEGRLKVTGANAINKIFIPDNLANAFAINRNESADMLIFKTTTSDNAITTGTNTSFDLGGGFKGYRQTAITTSTTLGKFSNQVPVNATSGAITITLPSASAELGRIYTITKIDSSVNAVTIAVASGDYIMDILNDTMSLTNQFDSTRLVASTDGTKNTWLVVV
jgi:hypothetical protein